MQASVAQTNSYNEAAQSSALRKQAALQAAQKALLATRSYLIKSLRSTKDLVAEAEIAEQWAHAASCLDGVGEWSLARKCFKSARFWQQQNPYV